MITVEVHFYAQLKDFFSEAVSLEVPVSSTAGSLLSILEKKNALAADWLKVSRVAGEDAFLAAEQPLADAAKYYILPPSSGG